MTTFEKNPHTEGRKRLNHYVFIRRLDSRLKMRFKHTKFSERFKEVNWSFLVLGAVAQFASLVTAFTMLSYLWVGLHIVIRVVGSVVMVIIIEVIKRKSTNDVMKGLFQYGDLEPFSAVLGVLMIGTSVYISYEGAKLLPSILIADAVEVPAKEKSSTSIELDYNNQITKLEKQRDNFRRDRLYLGKLARKDAKVVKQYNEDIKALNKEKMAAIAAMSEDNEAAVLAAGAAYEKQTVAVQVMRKELEYNLIFAAMSFEGLFIISLLFSWWYDTECKKEREKLNENGESSSKTSNVTKGTSNVSVETAAVSEGGARAVHKKASFKDYEQQNEVDELEKVQEVEHIQKEFTRHCLECNSPFVHKTHNHKYCKESCKLKAWKRKQKKTN